MIGEVTLQAGGRIRDTSNSRKIHFDGGLHHKSNNRKPQHCRLQ